MARFLTQIGRRRLARIVVLALCMGVVQSELASNVLAHHPEIQASVDCNGLISYTASAWETTQDPIRRVNTDVRIQLRTFNGSTWTSYSEIDQGQFLQTQNPAFQFSGVHQLLQPLPERFRLKVVAAAAWGPDQQFSTPGISRETEEETLPPCPGQPGAQMTIDCDEGGARIDFTHTGAGTSTLQLVSGTSLIDTVQVGSGQPVSKVYPMTEGETKTFTVKSGDTTVASETLTFDCMNPAATMTQSCVAGGIQVNLTNTGAELPVEFTVLKNGTQLEKVTVPAGGQLPRTYPMTEDETATFSVSGGGFSASNTFTFDCIEGSGGTPPPPPPPPAQVLGEQIRAPGPQAAPQAVAPQAQVEAQELPASGVEGDRTASLLMVAVVLLLAGLGLVITGKLSLEIGH